MYEPFAREHAPQRGKGRHSIVQPRAADGPCASHACASHAAQSPEEDALEAAGALFVEAQ